MNFDLSNENINLKKYNITDSSSFVVFPRYKLKNIYFKASNKIRGSYFDTVLKENIYISSNNIKKDAYFKKIELETNILQYDKNVFTTYFKEIEDNLFRFAIYPKTYQKELVYHCIVSKKDIKNKKIKPSSFLYKSFLRQSQKYNRFFGHSNKLILIQSFWQKAYFVTPLGFVLNLTKRFGDRHFFTGLNYIYEMKPKFKFKALVLLNYLLIKFYSNLINCWYRNKDAMSTIVLYYSLRNKMSYDFFNHHYRKRLKFRKSNVWLTRYNKLVRNKSRKINNYFFKLSLNLIKYHYNTNKNWINTLFIHKRNFLPLKFYSKQIELSTKVNTLNNNDKLILLKYIFNVLKYKYASGKMSYSNSFSSLSKIIYNKSLILACELNLEARNYNYTIISILDELLNRRFLNLHSIINDLTDKPNLLISKKFKYSDVLVKTGWTKLKIRGVYRHIMHHTLRGRLKYYNRKFFKNNISFNDKINDNKTVKLDKLIQNFYKSKLNLINNNLSIKNNISLRYYFLKNAKYKPPVYKKPIITRIPERFLKTSAHFRKKKYNLRRNYENNRTFI